jgi:hypothetical protein
LSLSVVDPNLFVDVDANALNYLEKFVNSVGEGKAPFMKRTLGNPANHVIVYNGLENRLQVKNCKLVYVEDTEDVFWRKSQKKKCKNVKFLESWAEKMISKMETL